MSVEVKKIELSTEKTTVDENPVVTDVADESAEVKEVSSGEVSVEQVPSVDNDIKKNEKKGKSRKKTKLNPRTANEAFLDSMYDSYKSRTSGVDTVSNASKLSETLDNYELLKQEGATFKCAFDVQRPDGTFMFMDNDVLIVLRRPFKSRRLRENASAVIGNAVDVQVENVDRENNTVYVKLGQKLDSTQLRLIEILDGAVNSNERLKVSGEIRAVLNNVVIVNIFGKSVFGACHISNWSNSYVRDIAKVCKVGEVVDFYVTGKKIVETKYGPEERYILSHAEFEEDAWAVLDNDKNFQSVLKNRGTLLVQCIDAPKNKSFWWGRSESIQGIEIMCNYTSSTRKVEVGRFYKCIVADYNYKEHILKCSPYAVGATEAVNTAAEMAKRLRESMGMGEKSE